MQVIKKEKERQAAAGEESPKRLQFLERSNFNVGYTQIPICMANLLHHLKAEKKQSMMPKQGLERMVETQVKQTEKW